MYFDVIPFWGVHRLVYRTTYLSADASRRAMTTRGPRISQSGYYHHVLALRLCVNSPHERAMELP
jgi:hypothetical protein